MITFKQMFSPAGRINRQTFTLSCICLILTSMILLTGVSTVEEGDLDVISKTGWSICLMLGVIFCYYLNVMMALKRLHDVNLSGKWMLLVILIPVLLYVPDLAGLRQTDQTETPFALQGMQFFFVICLFFFPGRKSYNRFGEKPRGLDVGKNNGEIILSEGLKSCARSRN